MLLRPFNRKTIADLHESGLRMARWSDDDLDALDRCLTEAGDDRDRAHAPLTSQNLPVLIQAGFFPDRRPRVVIDWVATFGPWRITEYRSAAEGTATPAGTQRYIQTRAAVRAWTGLLGVDAPAGMASGMAAFDVKAALAAGTFDLAALYAQAAQRGYRTQ